MSVSNTDNSVTYTGDASTDTYAYDFKIFANTELVVTEQLISTEAETVLTITTDYTVTGTGVSTGGDVVLVAGNLAATKKLNIRRVLPLTQGFAITENSDNPSASYENQYDKITMMIQELDNRLDRAIVASVFQSGVSYILPSPEAGKAIGWDSAATALENITV